MFAVSEIFRLEVPCDMHAPRVVRSALAATHDGCWSLEDGLLVASELVTNAVRHSGCESPQTLNVRVARCDGHLLISVQDQGRSGAIAEPANNKRRGSGGRGLQIIEQLSVRWGAERPDGYRVWAELPAEATQHSAER